jgi:hypothetical protein
MDMNLPLFPAPQGYVVDMANPQRIGVAANFWIGGVGMFLATIFLCIRVYTKAFLAKSFAADDSKSIRIHQPGEDDLRCSESNDTQLLFCARG